MERNAQEQAEPSFSSRALIRQPSFCARTMSRKSCCTRVSDVISGWKRACEKMTLAHENREFVAAGEHLDIFAHAGDAR